MGTPWEAMHDSLTALISFHHTLDYSHCGKGATKAFGEKVSSTFHEGAWGQANDLSQDGEEVPDAGPLGLPVLNDLEDVLAQTADLSFSVSLQSRTRS